MHFRTYVKFCKKKRVRSALTLTFDKGWKSVIKEVSKQNFKYNNQKVLNFMTTLVSTYLGLASIVLVSNFFKIIKSIKICHSVSSGRLDVTEICFLPPMHLLEIGILGRIVVIE